MARNFVVASSQFIEAGSSPVSGYPFSVAAWARTTDKTVTQQIVSLGSSSGAVQSQQALMINPTPVSGNLLIQANDDSGTGSLASTTSGVTNNTWFHAAAVCASSASRAVYLDGANKGTDTATRAYGTIDRLEIGRRFLGGAGSQFLTGDVAEVAYWNAALTDADVAALALGVSPLNIRPDALVLYAPLMGIYSPEIDVIGRRALTLTNAPALATHVRIFGTAFNFVKATHAYAITGTTKNNAGAALAACTVKLYRTSDDVEIQTTTSDGSGNYSFTVAGGVAYYIVAYKAGSPDVAGTTVNTLSGV